jgi:phospholipid transport system substrate-binding protein
MIKSMNTNISKKDPVMTARTALALLVSVALIAPYGAQATPFGQGVDSGMVLQTSSMLPITGGANQDAVSQGAKDFIISMGQRGIDFLANPNITIEAKKAEFAKLLDSSFDMSTIGRFSLGTYWKVATPAQKKEYQKLFRSMIIKVYSQRFSDYKGQNFDVQSVRKETDKDYIVTSFIVPDDGAKVQVDWRVRHKNGGYKVVDIIVENVSMAQTQRADFASVIQRGGGNVDVLLDHLRK